MRWLNGRPHHPGTFKIAVSQQHRHNELGAVFQLHRVVFKKQNAGSFKWRAAGELTNGSSRSLCSLGLAKASPLT
ncbi:hypothetical protein [Pseudomonas sp. GOM6]|uniref:hypothetical protein n=1 Tax=Pseudomonas sp. GOM6 TaxID=3036944 RepID=UPI00240A3735|nr:hypothetical protein [Pseudomonas sp. GOM6]MDG1582430.1 hypothetical protein [Pseudomonas sp. GOM6]